MEEYIESLDIELITSSMILSKAVERDIISKENADDLWKGMINKGINYPKSLLVIILMNFMKLIVKDF